MPDTPFDIRRAIEAHLAALALVRDGAGVIERIARTLSAALAAGGKVLTCGNGGSAAEALHLAEEMIGRFARDRAPMAAICLCADPAAMTCITNDYGYEALFARQVQALGRPGDVLVALSTSGRSPNVVRALEAGRQGGLKTVGLLGGPGSPAENHCDVALTMSAARSDAIQEIHLVAIHLILEYLDSQVP